MLACAAEKSPGKSDRGDAWVIPDGMMEIRLTSLVFISFTLPEERWCRWRGGDRGDRVRGKVVAAILLAGRQTNIHPKRDDEMLRSSGHRRNA